MRTTRARSIARGLLGAGVLSGGVLLAGPRAPLTAPPEIATSEVATFHDFTFFVEKRSAVPSGLALRLAGLYKGRRVGFEVQLGAAWKPGSRPDNPRGSHVPVDSVEGEVRILATGAESDAFLGVLDERYGAGQKPQAMSAETRFNCLSLGGDPRTPDKGPLHLKLVYGASDKKDYAELLLDLDLAAHRVVVREKDEAYRAAVVRALTKRVVE